ncbi:unnamed protein product [Coffea canephora]|uniref:DH200=94 genomic scaffold, scaffold_428 n=1 Tax=Coffea canephora TaxID=49390 RepID=A0A068VI26_COFCA|nr:unnamed protein product [Coffea canephora]
MSLKESDSVLSLFSFRIPRMSRPILTSFMRSRVTKPPPQIKMSPTLLSRQEFFYCSFFSYHVFSTAQKEETQLEKAPLSHVFNSAIFVQKMWLENAPSSHALHEPHFQLCPGGRKRASHKTWLEGTFCQVTFSLLV